MRRWDLDAITTAAIFPATSTSLKGLQVQSHSSETHDTLVALYFHWVINNDTLAVPVGCDRICRPGSAHASKRDVSETSPYSGALMRLC